MKKPTMSLLGAAAAAVVGSGSGSSLVVPAVPLLAPAVLAGCQGRNGGTPAVDTANLPGTQAPEDSGDTDTDTDAG